MQKTYFVTGNASKFREAKKILPNLVQKAIDLPEMQSLDIYEIVKHKLLSAFAQVRKPVVVEDQGLYLASLHGLPGPLIKWFLKTIGNAGLLKIVESFGNAEAYAIVLVGFYDGIRFKFFEGRQNGQIVSAKGTNGFGWDPIFLPAGSKKTFGEMSLDEKTSGSSRSLAFTKLKKFLD